MVKLLEHIGVLTFTVYGGEERAVGFTTADKG